jgi:Acetyltransferase (GNAT) domain
MSDVYLCTQRLALRRMRDADVDNLLLLNADQDVMRFIDRTPPTPQDVRAEVEQVLGAYERFPDHGTFVAESPDGGFLNWFGLTVREGEPAAPDLGYRLRPRGVGSGSGHRRKPRARRPRLHASGAASHRRHHGGQPCLSTGHGEVRLRYVRTFHAEFDDPLPGTEHGEVLYEITREEWAGRRRP